MKSKLNKQPVSGGAGYTGGAVGYTVVRTGTWGTDRKHTIGIIIMIPQYKSL